MLGPHAIALEDAPLSVSLKNSSRAMIREFLLNEEGFLSSKYTSTLKKYYPSQLAELLYIHHGMQIKFNTLMYLDRSDIMAGNIRPNLTQRDTSRYITHFSGLMYIQDYQIVKSCITDMMGYEFYLDNIQGNAGVRHCALITDTDTTDEAGNLTRPIGFMRQDYEVGTYSFKFDGDTPTWWRQACNRRHESAIAHFGNADTLQRFFHLNDITGYNGSMVLENMYRSIEPSGTQDACAAENAVMQEEQST